MTEDAPSLQLHEYTLADLGAPLAMSDALRALQEEPMAEWRPGEKGAYKFVLAS